MKGLLAWIVGATLVALSTTGAPRVIADENGEVHYWSSGTSYVPQDEARTTYVSQDRPVQFVDVSDDASAPGDLTSPMPAVHGHVYLVNDDPGYDLTGPSDHWFLMGDGTAFRDENWHNTGAAFASTGMMAGHEVVPITAEFRQDWLAVAAGDRPVRTFTAPRATSGAGVMAVVPMENTTNEPAMNQYSSTETHDTFRPVHHARARRMYHATRPVRYTSTHRMRTSNYQTASVEPAVKDDEAVETPATEAAETAVEVSQDRMGHELYQMGTSWYMKVDKDWYRAESWRGPFAPIKKRTVPREVKMSAKHPSRMDMD